MNSYLVPGNRPKNIPRNPPDRDLCFLPDPPRRNTTMTDRFCPMAFILITTFASLLVWMCAVLQAVPIR